MAINGVEGEFTADGDSAAVPVFGHFNVSLSGFGAATVAVRRSFDRGQTWKDVDVFTENVERRGYEPEPAMLYKLTCSGYGSGPIQYRLSAR